MRVIHALSGLGAMSFTIGAIFYLAPNTEIVLFDKEVVQGQFIRQLAEIKATESQVQQSTRRFNEVLNKVLVDTSQQKKVIILRKNDVFAGGVDITDEVRIKLSKAMRNKS
ncbi:type-F conjugative transfer system protein TrbI [Legionella bozemanae]|uniref:F pilus extension/retraction protein TrbI Inner membrane protein n=2 Tax=Legionella bozemanae TaxID=447 RepID=A0A0W0RFB2_LEGBO|nr:F pilus extension/retraction protein TrbI Inner membrane protein [Legionella bozemanae]STP14042.1 type-F conjugative transfer system protein TrbI [Legionella bozemanae]